MASKSTSSKGSVKTGFSGFGSNVVKSNKAAQAKQASTPAFSGAVSSAVKSGATKLTDKGSGGLQSQARSVATRSGSSTNTPTTTALTDTTMPVDTLADTSSTGIVDLPKTTVGTGFGDIVTAASQNNLALGLTPTGEAIKTETTSPEQTKALTVADQIKNIYGITPPEPTSMAGEFKKLQKELLPYRQNVNTLTAQIAEITNKAQADQLRLVGQGRGVPEVIIGGQQAQIAREAAINVLPLQAQLAAAQDDLELATETLNTWFQIKSKDVENQYNYQVKLYDTVVNYANEQQKQKLEDLRMEKQQQFELKKMAIQNQYDRQLKSMDNTSYMGADAPLYNGLNGPTATAVRAQVSAFKSEPLVTNFQTIQEGRNFANSIPTNTKNPADDQALIYALAKALDPGSVVREGEYATAQKYAQSWVKAYGSGVAQAIAGTGFLSQTARENIKNTINTKYNSSKLSYDTVSKKYVDSINNLTGRKDGDKFLGSYATPETSTQQNTINITPKDNAIFNSVVTPTAQNTAGNTLKSQFGVGFPGFNLFSFFK